MVERHNLNQMSQSPPMLGQLRCPENSDDGHADMYAGIITLAIVGLLVNYGLVWIERRATRWRGNAEDGGAMPH